MINKISIFFFAVIVVAITLITSCKKTTESLPLEPIALVHPDSAIVMQFPGDDVPIEIKFTTDRPINWIKGMVDIDTFYNMTGYVPTYPDTLFYMRLDSLDPRVNLYTYTGTYHIVDTLMPFDIIRFQISFQAGKTSFTTGQNYPAGVVTATKEFRIDVR